MVSRLIEDNSANNRTLSKYRLRARSRKAKIDQAIADAQAIAETLKHSNKNSFN